MEKLNQITLTSLKKILVYNQMNLAYTSHLLTMHTFYNSIYKFPKIEKLFNLSGNKKKYLV